MSRRLIVLLFVLFWGAIATLQAGTLGPEIVVSALDNNQFRPAIAFAEGHDEYLVVWHNYWGGGYQDIYAQRISADGVVLSGFSVASLTNDSFLPAVAYDPTRDRYLVVWTYDLYGDASDIDLLGRFIPRLGPDAGLSHFAIDSNASSQYLPKVEFALAQDEFMVVWENLYASAANDVSARRVLADGSGFPDGRFSVSTGTYGRAHPDITYNLARNEYLVAFTEWVGAPSASYEIYAVRMTAEGVILGGGEFAVANWYGDDEWEPAVASCHGLDGFLVTWQNSQPDIYARFVTGDGVVDGPPIVIDDSSLVDMASDVACSLDGAHYLVAWQTEYLSGLFGVWARAVMANHIADTMFEVVSPTASWESTTPAVAGGPGGFLIAWEHERESLPYWDIHARIAAPVVFYDGFETGGTTRWSSAVP